MSVTETTLDSWKEAGVAADFRRDGVRFSLVWDVLRDVVSARVAETGRQALDIVDVGGGTGGLAVPFAALGHNVTVVDPSPDALAAAQRRAAEAGARLTAGPGAAASPDKGGRAEAGARAGGRGGRGADGGARGSGQPGQRGRAEGGRPRHLPQRAGIRRFAGRCD